MALSSSSSSSAADRAAVGRHPRDGRMPAALAISAGFGAGLVLAAAFTVLGPSHTTGIVVLAMTTVALSWFSTVPGALGIGATSWLFYSGFVAHSHGQLAVTGIRDGVVATVLVGLALVVSVLRAVLTYRRVRYAEVRIPLQRRSDEDPRNILADHVN
jgi:hypothetical protein